MKNDHSEPTYENQLWHARKLLDEQGPRAIAPHAMVGRQCKCHDCFCCAALEVYTQYRSLLKPRTEDK